MKSSLRHLNGKTVTIYVRRPGSRIVTEKIQQNIEKHCEFFRIFDVVFDEKSDW